MKIEVEWSEVVTYKKEFEVGDNFFELDPPSQPEDVYTAFERYCKKAEELIDNMSPTEFEPAFVTHEDREITTVDEVK